MGKDNFSIKTEMQTQLKKVNHELRILNSLHCSIKATAKRAIKSLKLHMSNELDERELKLDQLALQILESMASEEFCTVVNGYLPKLQLCTSYYCFISASNFMNLSTYIEEFDSHRNSLSDKEFYDWSSEFLEKFKPKLSKTLKPIANKAILIVTLYTGYNFTFKSFNALCSAPGGPFKDLEVTFEFVLK